MPATPMLGHCCIDLQLKTVPLQVLCADCSLYSKATIWLFWEETCWHPVPHSLTPMVAAVCLVPPVHVAMAAAIRPQCPTVLIVAQQCCGYVEPGPVVNRPALRVLVLICKCHSVLTASLEYFPPWCEALEVPRMLC